MEFDLRNCLEEVVDLAIEQAHRKELELNILIAPQVPVKLEGDLVRLSQVLSLLTIETVRATLAGEIRIQVKLLAETETTATIEIAIADTSSGLSPEEEYRLQSFLQHSPDEEVPEIGLTYAVCHKLIGLMAGDMGIENTPGRGLSIWFAATFAKRSDANNVIPQIDLTGLRLLIVSENETNRMVVRQQAESWHVEVVEAANATVAMNLLRRAVDQGMPFQIAILDMKTSVLNGAVLGLTIRSEPSLDATSLAILTFSGETEIAEQLLQRGFAANLKKPIRPLPLLQCLIEAGAKLHGATEPSIAASDEIIDIEHLVRICEGNLEAIESMLDFFVEDSPQLLLQMQNSVIEKDFFQLGQTAHYLKGSSATLGIHAIATAASRLKHAATDCNLPLCGELVDELAKTLERVTQEQGFLRAELQIRLSGVEQQQLDNPTGDCRRLILLVDDDTMTLRFLQESLQRVPNYEVTIAKGGEAAWKAMAEHSFDAIVSDWSMPDISGIVLCQRLKFCPQLPSAASPFILLTAYSDIEYQRIAREAGVDDFMVKPVQPDALRAKVAYWISMRN